MLQEMKMQFTTSSNKDAADISGCSIGKKEVIVDRDVRFLMEIQKTLSTQSSGREHQKQPSGP